MRLERSATFRPLLYHILTAIYARPNPSERRSGVNAALLWADSGFKLSSLRRSRLILFRYSGSIAAPAALAAIVIFVTIVCDSPASGIFHVLHGFVPDLLADFATKLSGSQVAIFEVNPAQTA